MAIDIIARGMVEDSNGYISQLFNITKGGETVSGESSYTISNAVDYPLLGLSLYGKSTQNGTPSPDAPVDIVSVGDNGFDIVSQGDKHFNLLSVRDNGGNIITKQPVSTVAKVGETATFSVATSGAGIKYQWQYSTDSGKTWTNFAQVVASFTISSVQASYSGWQYRCVVTDENGNSITSNVATLYVISDNCSVKTGSIVLSDELCGIPVDSGGNYTDNNGQQWVCDEFVYNVDGTSSIIKNTAKIDSYNGEAIATPYISTTGALTTGTTVIYAIDTPQENELTAAEVDALRTLQTFDGVTSISNSAGAEMSVKYCTNNALSEFVYPVTMGLQKQIDELRAAILSMGGNV